MKKLVVYVSTYFSFHESRIPNFYKCFTKQISLFVYMLLFLHQNNFIGFKTWNLFFVKACLEQLFYPNLFLREQNKKQWLQNIKSFQFIQADKRRQDEKTARDTENTARRATVNQMHDKAQVRPF